MDVPVIAKDPIVKERAEIGRIIKCCDERIIKHNSPELALKEKLIAQPKPSLAHLQTPA